MAVTESTLSQVMALFFELLQRNVDVRHQIHLVVDVEDIITTSTSPIKKPMVQLEGIVDNSLAIVPLCDVGTSNQGITEASTEEASNAEEDIGGLNTEC